MRFGKVIGLALGAVVLVAAGAAGASSLRPVEPEVGRLDAVHAVVAASGAPKAIGRGSSVSPSRFVPIAPCRLFDSRKAAAGILEPGSTRTVQVAGAPAIDVPFSVSVEC